MIHVPMLIGGTICVAVSILLLIFPKQVAEFYRKIFAAYVSSRDSVFSKESSPVGFVLAGIVGLILGISLIVRALN